MNRDDLRVFVPDLCGDPDHRDTYRPVSDAELAEMGYVNLTGIDVDALHGLDPDDTNVTETMTSVPWLGIDAAQIREGVEAYRNSDHLSAALLWAKLVSEVLAALDKGDTE